MNAEVKAKWLEALRSGLFPQGRGFLATRLDDGKVEYCCLGVLCEVLSIPSDPCTTNSGIPILKYDGEHYNLPASAMKAAGLDSHRGFRLPDEQGGRYLDTINDSGASFTSIARLIETHL